MAFKTGLKKLRLRKQLAIADGFMILFGTFLAMNLLIGSGVFPVKSLAALLPGGATVINQMLIQQILQFSVMTGLTLLFLRWRGVSLGQIGLHSLPQKSWIWKAALCGVALFFVMLFVMAVMTWLFPQWAQPQTVSELLMQAGNVWEWSVAIVMVCILAPISEELLFRGYIFHSLQNSYSLRFSVLAASLMFGCMHFDLFRLVPLTVTGVCLNGVAIRAGSLWGSIIMHSVWNFMMTLVLMIA